LAERDPDHVRKRTGTATRRSRALLDAADVHVVSLPDEVGSPLTVSDHRAHEPLEVVPRALEGPRVLADLHLLEPGDRVVDLLDDLGVLLA
jgi:hypothetical protein